MVLIEEFYCIWNRLPPISFQPLVYKIGTHHCYQDRTIYDAIWLIVCQYAKLPTNQSQSNHTNLSIFCLSTEISLLCTHSPGWDYLSSDTSKTRTRIIKLDLWYCELVSPDSTEQNHLSLTDWCHANHCCSCLIFYDLIWSGGKNQAVD